MMAKNIGVVGIWAATAAILIFSPVAASVAGGLILGAIVSTIFIGG